MTKSRKERAIPLNSELEKKIGGNGIKGRVSRVYVDWLSKRFNTLMDSIGLKDVTVQPYAYLRLAPCHTGRAAIPHSAMARALHNSCHRIVCTPLPTGSRKIGNKQAELLAFKSQSPKRCSSSYSIKFLHYQPSVTLLAASTRKTERGTPRFFAALSILRRILSGTVMLIRTALPDINERSMSTSTQTPPL